MNTDHDQLAARFGAFRAATAPTITGPGGPEIRARAKQHQRRSAAVALAAVVLILLGASAFLLRPANGSDRLTPADGSSPATALTPDPSWKQTVRNARIDLRPADGANCGNPLLQFRDGRARGLGQTDEEMIYTIEDDRPMLTADIDRDGRLDYLVTIGCDRAHKEPCTESKRLCALRANTPYVMKLHVLRGTPDNLTTMGSIRGTLSSTPPGLLQITIRDDGLIRLEEANDPGYILIWGYRDGTMQVIKRWVLTASPSPTG